MANTASGRPAPVRATPPDAGPTAEAPAAEELFGPRAIAPQAVLANAVEDALRPLGVVVRRGPLSPSRVRDLIRTAPRPDGQG
ncbi:hypothetical protein [Streptomyces sp. 142MFCol3.1]|uniref:hypothetical protein n=1 Tax=Streptomyces sp. 142MFCol3.1 TaxID=1172179 RepID=UPI001319FEC4|nr:hypothetical protein [Streptomyces sp. 142MFCol3.1]